MSHDDTLALADDATIDGPLLSAKTQEILMPQTGP